MSTRQERLDKTFELVLDESVSLAEGWAHLYSWVRFEWAIMRRNKYAEIAQKHSRILNTNLEVWEFCKSMANN